MGHQLIERPGVVVVLDEVGLEHDSRFPVGKLPQRIPVRTAGAPGVKPHQSQRVSNHRVDQVVGIGRVDVDRHLAERVFAGQNVCADAA